MLSIFKKKLFADISGTAEDMPPHVSAVLCLMIEIARIKPMPGAMAICHKGRLEISSKRISSVSISKPAIIKATRKPVSIDRRRTGLFPVGSSFFSFSITPFIPAAKA